MRFGLVEQLRRRAPIGARPQGIAAQRLRIESRFGRDQRLQPELLDRLQHHGQTIGAAR